MQGSARDRDRREKERQQLADLVGKNLTYVSQVSPPPPGSQRGTPSRVCPNISPADDNRGSVSVNVSAAGGH